ncbi:MAG: hypothetical protein KAU14_08810 [Thermoplasmata archaeon]|nr:hypothetical protein [Thermoplasmata archaeon]
MIDVIPGIKDLGREVNVLNESLKKLESQLTYLNSVLSSMERQTSGLKDNVGAMNENVGAMNQTLASLGEILASLTLIVLQINKFLQVLQLPLKILTNFNTVVGQGYNLLYSGGKTLLGQAEGLVEKAGSLTHSRDASD